MCIVGIILVDFIEISIKSIIKHSIGVNLVKITKFGREIIEISIISMVQTHKLPILQGINQNFDLFPQKWVLRQVLLQFGVPLAKFCQYLPSLCIFIIILTT